jgi:peptidoglycan/LPS O-acetylase OafA/YrhL
LAVSSAANRVADTSELDHLKFLDGLRALCALFVVLHHAYLTVWNVAAHRMPPPKVFAYTQWLIHGTSAVGVFIVISGYCLMLPVIKNDGVLKRGAIAFFKKRARRILPPYYFAMLFSALLAALAIHVKTGTQWDASVPVTLHGIFNHIFLVNDALNDTSINYVFWSISVEWRIYFVFPILVILWRKWGAARACMAGILAGYILRYVTNHLGFGGVTAHYLALFSLGMLGATISMSADPKWRALRERLPWNAITMAIAAILVVAHCVMGWEKFAGRYVWIDFVIGLWAMSLLVTASQSVKSTWLLSARLLTWIGTFAYSLYLIHAPLLQVLWQYILRPMHLPALFAFLTLAFAGVPTIVLLSYGFYLLCERPFINKPASKTT